MQSQIKNKLILFVFLFFKIVIAQEYTSKNISTLDGLPSNEIFSIFKDSRGILWVGTGNGLSKITNGEIKNYYKSDGLAHNNCWSIVEDQNKNMWFASYGGGLTFYDGNKFSVYNIENGLTDNNIRKLFLYKTKLFIGTEDGLNIIDVNTKKIENYKPKSEYEKFQIMDFFEYKGVVYIQNFREGLWKYEELSKELNSIESSLLASTFSILKLKNASTVIYTYDGNWRTQGINQISIDSLLNKKEPLTVNSGTVIFNLLQTSENIIYAAGVSVNQPTGGLFEYNLKTNEVKNVTSKYGIESNDIWSLFYDEKQNFLYVGTLDFGLYTIKLDKSIQFYPNKLYFSEENKIIDFDIYNGHKIILKDNELIIENSSEKYSINKEQFFNYTKKSLSYNKKNLKINSVKTQFDQKIDEVDFKFFKVYNDLIWIKTTTGLFAVDLKGNPIKFIPFYIGEFDFIDKDTIFFQRPYNKFHIVSNLNDTLHFKVLDLNEKNNPRDITHILKNEKNHYFISAFKGIYTYENNSFYSLVENNVWNLKEFKHAVLDSKNRLVVSNSLGDIFTLSNSKDFKIESEIKSNQYIGNTITYLDSYKEYLIIATEKGINLYKDGTIIFLDKSDGINDLATSGKVLNDRLYITTKEGIYEIDLKAILKTKKTDFKVVITNLEINYKNILEDKLQFGIFKNNAIELPYNQNIVNIKYGISNHPEPKKLNYSYKVNGLQNSEWTEWNLNNTINLPYLPNGNFEILVKIKDLSNGKTYQYQLLKININPPFWKTWWFVAISIVVLGLIVYLIYRRRTKELKEKNRIQKRLVETKMEALQSQMNPHFIFNAMNSIQNFIIDNNTDDALMYMGEFSKIIRQTLNNSSLQKITLYEDLQYIQSYITIENMRYKNKINVEVNIDDTIDLMDIEIPPMLIQPFIENVFVHAFDSTISNPKLIINYKLIKESLIIEIIDNGKGLNETNKNRLNNSKGIKLTKERISLLGPEQSNSIEIKSTPENGTIVRIDFNTNVNFQKHYDN